MQHTNKVSAIAIATLFVFGPLACFADSEASYSSMSESKDASQAGSFGGSENSRMGDNQPSSQAVHSSESSSVAQAGRPHNENDANLEAGARLLQAQENARKQAAVEPTRVPSTKVVRYNWAAGPKHASGNNRRFMVETIQQSARTK